MDSTFGADCITTTTKAHGRTRSISRTGTKRSPLRSAKTATQKTTVQEPRRKRAEIVPEENGSEVIIHPPVDLTSAAILTGRSRSAPLVYEAMELLRTCGYHPVRVSEPSLPVNIIGIKKNGSLLVCTIRSRLPVPNAATLHRLFTGKVVYLCGLAGRVRDRIMIWVYSPACGWRYYLVYPGGLRFDLDFPKSIQ